jgi:hypothetical protein
MRGKKSEAERKDRVYKGKGFLPDKDQPHADSGISFPYYSLEDFSFSSSFLIASRGQNM